MKKDYEKPTIEIEEFEVEDILTTSGLGFLDNGFGQTVNWNDIY